MDSLINVIKEMMDIKWSLLLLFLKMGFKEEVVATASSLLL
jgi:hypothetical protein